MQRPPSWTYWLLLPLLAGALLRGYGLADQILTGDELHSVNAALNFSVAEVLSTWTYFGADYCVPLTALYRLLMDWGMSLSELHFRAPVLAAGLLSLIAMPLAIAHRFGRPAAIVLAWLLALSPMWVLYGRIIRSYVPMTVLAFAAAMSFERWWRTRSRSAAVGYVGCASLAIYFHLGAAPFVLSPLVYAILDLAVRRSWRADLLPLAILSIGTLLSTSLLLFPARATIAELVSIHGRGYFPEALVWWDVLRMQAGVSSPLLAGLLFAVMVRGVWVSYWRDRRFTFFLGTLAIGHIIGLAILSPNHFQHLVVANRYMLPLLPFALALVALGLVAPWSASPSPRANRLQASAICALLAVLFLLGPLTSARFRCTSFAHSRPALLFISAGNSMPEENVPDFYFELARTERSKDRVILEFPWLNLSAHAFDVYQHIHRRGIRVGSLNRY
ncbi:MAG: hypothetical protein V3T33_00880, partial [Myxococcota bacterium]